MPGPAVELPLDHEIHGQIGISSCDRVLGALADRQHGRVARWQLDAFMSRGAIEHRLLTGRLRQVRRGVYAVGYVSDTREARWMTAVLAAGPGSVLSHRSAAAMWGLRRTNPAWGEVTVGQRTRCGGVRVHHALLPPDEITTRDGIPVTTVPRTILDLAAVLRPHEVERAMARAEERRLTDALSVPDLCARYPRRRGVATLRRLLDEGRFAIDITRSELEDRFLAALQEAGLPRPRTNVLLTLRDRTIEADCLWSDHRVIAEPDGRTHATDKAFHDDRARDRTTHAAGYRVVRITWKELHHSREEVMRDLADVLTLTRCSKRWVEGAAATGEQPGPRRERL